VGENIFLNLAAECALILDYMYSIHKIFRDVNNVNFISNIGRSKEHEVYHLQ